MSRFPVRALGMQVRRAHMDSFHKKDLQSSLTSKKVELPPLETLQFGKTFTNHMLTADWTRKDGWQAPQIIPYGNLSLSPAASSLHYALQCFEGMKAYRKKDGTVLLFRPEMNAKRMNRSCHRLDLPTFSTSEFIECLKEYLKIEKEWIPQEKGYSLYLRPTMISTDVCLGVAPAAAAKFFTISCPVGPYYKEGFKPVKLIADSENARAWPGGVGSFKVGGNYAPTILPAVHAAAKGYSQVLWLGPNDEVTEVGAMNMMFFWKNEAGERELITAPLDGTILPGVTRDSILSLAREWGEFKVSEKNYTIGEVVKASEEGRIIEAFGTGTAAIVSTVECINYKGKDYRIPVPEPKTSIAVRMMETIMSIQYGDVEHEWSVKVC